MAHILKFLGFKEGAIIALGLMLIMGGYFSGYQRANDQWVERWSLREVALTKKWKARQVELAKGDELATKEAINIREKSRVIEKEVIRYVTTNTETDSHGLMPDERWLQLHNAAATGERPSSSAASGLDDGAAATQTRNIE